MLFHVKLVVGWGPTQDISKYKWGKESSNGGNKRIAGPPSGVQAALLEPSQEAAGLVADGRAEIFPNIASHFAEAQPVKVASHFAYLARAEP